MKTMIHKKLLFVGQAPSRTSDPSRPFSGQCGKFLAELLGTSQEDMLAKHDFINVLDTWPGKGLGGDKFPMAEAKQAAMGKLDLLRGKTVVLLGANVARAFNVSEFRYLGIYEIRSRENVLDIVASPVTVIPHPSGVNRYYNSVENKLTVSKFLRELQ